MPNIKLRRPLGIAAATNHPRRQSSIRFVKAPIQSLLAIAVGLIPNPVLLIFVIYTQDNDVLMDLPVQQHTERYSYRIAVPGSLVVADLTTTKSNTANDLGISFTGEAICQEKTSSLSQNKKKDPEHPRFGDLFFH